MLHLSELFNQRVIVLIGPVICFLFLITLLSLFLIKAE
jgi:hypothetical protein